MPVMPTVLRDYAAAARGASPDVDYGDVGVRAGSVDIMSPAVQIPAIFPIQSYLDSTALASAILMQAPNEPIVRSTLRPDAVPGYAVALAPWSETIVAVEFQGTPDAVVTNGGQPGASSTHILKPGEILRPFGRPGSSSGAFSGVKWGLPFGWLGGGAATLIIFTTPDSYVNWGEAQEILFHRARYQVVAAGSAPTIANAAINWPVRFPWPNASRSSTSQPQAGRPHIAPNVTRAEIRLRVSTLADVASIRFYMMQTDHADVDSAGAFTTDISYKDVTFESYSNPVGLVNLTTNFQVQEIVEGPLLRWGGDSCKVVLVDNGTTSVANQYVDILRYGKL